MTETRSPLWCISALGRIFFANFLKSGDIFGGFCIS